MKQTVQIVNIDDRQFAIPEDYRKAKPLPDDPPGSVVYEKNTSESTDILMLSAIEKSQAMPFDDETGLIDTLNNLIGESQGIIEVKTGWTAKDLPFVYTVIKSLKQPSGVQYILTFQLDLGMCVLNIQGYFDEYGVTGMRDAAVWEYAVREGIISSTDRSKWSADPYRPDFQRGVPMNLSEHARFDDAFPTHPLSELRRFVHFLVQEN